MSNLDQFLLDDCGLATRYIRSIVSCHCLNVFGSIRAWTVFQMAMKSSQNLLITSFRTRLSSKGVTEIPEKDFPGKTNTHNDAAQ